jgi:hypothetical protein
MARGRGGFIGQDGLNAPDSPTSVSGSVGDQSVSVTFTAPTDVGGSAITGYVATSNNGIGAAGSSSPITVTGLTNGTSYTFSVWAINTFGYSSPSSPSSGLTPAAQYAYIAGYSSANRERISLMSAGNSANFGTFADDAVTYQSGASSNTRGIVGGSGRTSNDFQYWTLASTGVSQVFGDAVQSGSSRMTSNNTRALNAAAVTDDNTIEYLTIASTGNGTDFGDLTVSRGYFGALSSTTRSLFMGGWPNNGVFDTVDYVTIASTGNATDFGDLTGNRSFCSGLADGTRGVCSGGLSNAGPTTYVNVMDYCTIASTGNFTDFGDATQTSRRWRGAAGTTRGLFMGSDAGSGSFDTNRIDSITIQSTGNATDYGDLVKSGGTTFGSMSDSTVAVQP